MSFSASSIVSALYGALAIGKQALGRISENRARRRALITVLTLDRRQLDQIGIDPVAVDRAIAPPVAPSNEIGERPDMLVLRGRLSAGRAGQ